MSNIGSYQVADAILSFQGTQPTGSEEDDVMIVYHICAWWPYWSCDRDRLNIFSFNPSLEALYEMCLQQVKLLLRRCLKLSKYDESPGSKVKE